MTLSPEEIRKLVSFAPAVDQPVAKLIGTRHPYPVYAIPFTFRGEDRILEYTLFELDNHTVGSASWLRCLSEPWHACSCCPEFTVLEDMAVLVMVAIDIAKPGDPLPPEECR